jgi:uncharacterized protein (UPF0335 family)
MEGFNSELQAFIGRIERRAKEKTDKLIAEVNSKISSETIFFMLNVKIIDNRKSD